MGAALRRRLAGGGATLSFHRRRAAVELAVASLAFAAAVLCAGVMGFAIQRGATCTVAAVEEVLDDGRATRLRALVEASLWVAGGLALAQWLQRLPTAPAGHPLTRWVVLGGVLLGLGAWVNRACVFGAIARLGSGDFAYLATPLGFYLGCLSVDRVFAPPLPETIAGGSPLLRMPAWIALPFVAVAAWRLAQALRDRGAFAARIWSPHTATTVIGITFFATLMLSGGWAYTDLLAELAHGMAASVVARGLLALALLLGAIWGGWSAGRLRRVPLRAAGVLRCLAGGLLMGWGSLLIPGGNDGLILVGMPLLWPYAWAAFAAMGLSIGAALWLQRAVARRASVA